MSSSGCAKIIGGDVQVNLRACDQAMPEQIANRDQTDAGTNQMRSKSVAAMYPET